MRTLSVSDICKRLDLTESRLTEILDRVNAAAVPDGTTDWVDLVAPDAPDDLRNQLQSLRASSGETGTKWNAERIDAVRRAVQDQDLDGFVVPQADPHMGEYIPARHQRLAWLTGFTGSAGLALLHRDAAALFVDGRYTIQAAEQVDASTIEVRHFQKPPAKEWLCDRISEGERIGYDATLLSISQVDHWRKALEKKGAEFVPVASNPIDRNWPDQPPEPLAPIVPHALCYSGESLEDKCARLGQRLADDGLDAMVFNQLDAVAWLLNVRGNDVANTPVSVAYAVLHKDGTADLYIDPLKQSEALITHLGNRVTVREIDTFGDSLKSLGAAGSKVGLAAGTATDWLRVTLDASGADIALVADIVEKSRAIKNETELEGTRSAHRRDAAAIARTLKWLSDTAPSGEITELDVVARLEFERGREDLHRGPSFDTISGAGPHGAIVHYRVDADSNMRIEPGSLLLLDSGAQFLDGTTDITRTIAVGSAPDDAADCFTLVLKGHIALAKARFPKGTTGAQLDTLARQFLWDWGLNFDHGTGHGVGSYLGVHEGPQRISPAGSVKLEPGMILSNEPGYYKQDAFGIRIENLVVVQKSPVAENFLEFETITFAPIDRTLINPAMLSTGERDWLNAYHARVLDIAGPQLQAEDRAWLGNATAPL